MTDERESGRDGIVPKGPLSRREFLRVAGLTGLAVGVGGGLTGALAGCGGGTTTTTAGDTPTTAAPTASATTASAATTTAAQPQVLKIGDIEALTGFGSEAHIPSRDGAQLCVDWLNDKGGLTVKGQKYKLELVVEDGKGTVEGYTAAANKMVFENKVQYVVGGVETPFLAAINAVTEPAKVLHASLYTSETPAELGPETPMTFCVQPAIRIGIIASLAYLKKTYPDAKTLAVINPGDGAAPILTGIIKQEGAKQGLSVVTSYDWPFDITDWNPAMTTLLQSKPDIIFHTNGWDSLIGGLIKSLRELGFKGPIFGSNYGSFNDLLTYAGSSASTDYFGHEWTPDVSASDAPAVLKEITALANQKLGKFHSLNTMGWNGVWCIAQAIENAQSLDPVVIAEAWLKMSSMETASGTGVMGGAATYGANRYVVSPVANSALVNGKVVYKGMVTVQIP